MSTVTFQRLRHFGSSISLKGRALRGATWSFCATETAVGQALLGQWEDTNSLWSTPGCN